MSFDPDRVTRPLGPRALAKKYQQPRSKARAELLAEHERALAKLGVKPKEPVTKPRYWR